MDLKEKIWFFFLYFAIQSLLFKYRTHLFLVHFPTAACRYHKILLRLLAVVQIMRLSSLKKTSFT